MKALLIKDLISIKRQMKVTLCILLLYAVMALFQRSFSFLTSMVALLCIMLPVTSIAYDEAAKWDKYALSMPFSRKKLVWSKYCLGILSGLIGMLFSIAVSVCFLVPQSIVTLKEVLFTSFTVWEVSVILLSVLLPLLFQFGVEKGRMLLIVVICIPFLLNFLRDKAGISMPSAQFLHVLSTFLPVFVVSIVLFSAWLSIRIYSNKEF